MAVEGTTLYAWANGKLFVLPFATGLLESRGSVAIPGSVNAARGRGRLFVGDDRAYAVHTRGVDVLDVGNPDGPVLLQANDTVQQGWKHVAPNGWGRSLAVLGVNPAASNDDDVQVRNVRFQLNAETLVLDGTFPFEYVYRVPTNRVGSSLVFAAVATDTGGSQGRTTNSISNVAADASPPAVAIDSPGEAQEVRAEFLEDTAVPSRFRWRVQKPLSLGYVALQVRATAQ